ncbi:IBR domain [Arabidopsis suecica]|uniref:RBR-type E3 ubiquitin transferase n=1 Tax=Arabidopsis suecica TaxID=45249 RepID=A0A8T1ZVL8_ARASU|nr:IBR domain [Arabidopsis suecica]
MVSTNSTVATLVKEVGLLQKRFSSCQSLPVCKDITFVHQLVEAAISSQIKPREETCAICYEDFQCDKMFEVPGCFHIFCDVCMKEHLRRTLVCGKRAICPMEDCESEIHREACVGILDPEQLSVIDQRKMESEINVRDRVYCPEPTCSALMAKDMLLKHTNEFFLGAEQLGARKCMVCGTFFCINCSFKWHYHITCDEFRKTQTYQISNHAKFESVAERHGLKKCRVCNTWIERVYGCNHMTCKCKYEFCYTCGAEWINKEQTCKCRLMD